MMSERRYVWIAVSIVLVAVTVAFVIFRVREEFAPEPGSALVAVEVGGSGVGEVGTIRLRAGESFTLHAVLVAHDRQGEPFYYTQAKSLRLNGRAVAADRIRPWDRGGEIAVMWFTLEGFRPFMEVATVEELDEFRFQETFRPEWGRGWSVAGSVTPGNHALARGFERDEEVLFGTARYHVRIEKYFRSTDPAPMARFRSPGADDVGSGTNEPSMVVSTLRVGLERVSAVFGTPQLEPVEGGPEEVMNRLRRWYEDGLSFSRLLVLGGLLGDHGTSWADLEWAQVDLEEGPTWGAIGTGDLLRSGERIVVLYADVGVADRLDYDDLCIDLVESASVRRLGEIFEGGGVLDWADLESRRGRQADGDGPADAQLEAEQGDSE